MKERGIIFNSEMVRAIIAGNKTATRRPVKGAFEAMESIFIDIGNGTASLLEIELCPFGKIGDRIWVRETWGICPDCNVPRYKADRGTDTYSVRGRWTPSIHMPSWASRITLEITDVRAERVRDITEGDAVKEGVKCGIDCPDFRIAFGRLWDSIYPGSWERNDFCWVIEFERIDK